MTFPIYGVTNISTRFPMVETQAAISINELNEDGTVHSTFETLTFSDQQYVPFQVTEDNVKQLVADHYQTTVDHVRILAPVASSSN
jgi:hypothetical protein